MSQLIEQLSDLSDMVKTISLNPTLDLSIKEMTEEMFKLPAEFQVQSDLCDKILNQKPFIDEFIEGKTEFLFIEDEEVPEGFFKQEQLSNLKELVWNARKVDNEEFMNLQIESVILPYCESLGSQAFWGCTKLNKVSLPQCKRFGSIAFGNCNNLEVLSLPGCVEIPQFNSIILGLAGLKELSLPNCEKISTGSFIYMNNLVSLSLPACKIIESQGITGQNYILSEVTLPKCEYLGTKALDAFRSVSKVFLPGSILCDIESIDSIPTWEQKQSNWTTVYRASCYVPENLLEQYKNHPVWQNISYNIHPIEEA